MRKIDTVIVHCSATPPSMDIGRGEIYQWHVVENGWSDVGYHYIIRRDGTVDNGRPLERIGAHARGHNRGSIGICMVGGTRQGFKSAECNFTAKQWDALFDFKDWIDERFDNPDWIGHNDVSDKACPTFNVKAMFKP